jgi:hypothetical protein
MGRREFAGPLHVGSIPTPGSNPGRVQGRLGRDSGIALNQLNYTPAGLGRGMRAEKASRRTERINAWA